MKVTTDLKLNGYPILLYWFDEKRKSEFLVNISFRRNISNA